MLKRMDQLALALLIFAGLIWGLWGLFQFNLVYYVFGQDWIDRLIYFILGSAAIYAMVTWKNVWTAKRARK